MSRSYTTIEEQNMYDITIQKFGDLNDMDQVIRQIPDLNTSVPFGTTLVLNDTQDDLGRRFDANKTLIATGDAGRPEVSSGGFQYGFPFIFH